MKLLSRFHILDSNYDRRSRREELSTSSFCSHGRTAKSSDNVRYVSGFGIDTKYAYSEDTDVWGEKTVRSY